MARHVITHTMDHDFGVALRRTLIVTEQCLLSPTRNPNLDRAGIEHLLKVRGSGF